MVGSPRLFSAPEDAQVRIEGVRIRDTDTIEIPDRVRCSALMRPCASQIIFDD
jgi:hypothetical protein